ncbi:ATP-dependent helicase [Thermovibrio sp.]
MEKLLKDLNPQQKEAVLYFDSPLLILAGAGSGKTRVITYKIAYMIKELSFSPSSILAITFTNKAAKEMKERISSLIGEESGVWISTFHSFSLKLLRLYGKEVGVDKNFLVVDEEDRRRILKEVVKELNLDPELYSPKTLSSCVSNVKNGLYSLDSLITKFPRIYEIYDLYNQKLKQASSLDFDDLLLYGKELLTSEFGRKIARKFNYVLIDEYQDTNKVQYEMAKALTYERGNICVVGDEDQCIYTWRGANIENILSFERDFKDARVIKLEKNYRCTKTILTAANAVIANNRLRKGKELYTDNPQGEPIRLFRAENEVKEAEFVAKTVKFLIKKGISPKDIAVFYRTNSLSRVFEDALRREGIPYQIVGGLKFYERKEVKDLIAYLRLILLDSDPVSLLRVLNVPRRGLGSKSEELLRSFLEEGKSSLEALEKLKDSLKQEKQRNAVDSLINVIKKGKEFVETLPPYDFVDFLLKELNYEDYLRREFQDDWESRLENVKELGNTVQEMAEREGLRGKELYLEFLSTLALSSEQDSLKDEERVVLMTVHASKGLEFPVVFIVGLEEGIFPHARSSDSSEEVEEERRLFYVAITRAKKLLTLSYSKERRLFGSRRQTTPSRFLSEIPPYLVKEVKRKENKPSSKTLPSTSHLKEKRPKMVYHKKFGKGVVERVEGSGDNAKITAYFSGYGKKTVLKKFLEILS